MSLLNVANKNKIVLALGFFDCMHIAHRQIASKTRSLAQEMQAESCIFTFRNGIKATPQLYDFDERVKLYDSCGIENIIALDFNEQLSCMSPDQFLDFLFNSYNIAAVVCGYDYKFGNRALGNADLLSAYCDARGVACYVVDKMYCNGERISSSKIKEKVISGDIEGANVLLEVPYHMIGKVVAGRGEGHLFGFPTANLLPKSNKIAPKFGVYGTMCDINGSKYKAETNVGLKPTFDDNAVSIETFIDNFSGNLYDKEIVLYFHKFIRETKKFDNAIELKNQIYSDMRW